MAVEFTKEQQAVIDARDCNILVSAAAGSGKTAVLVERIIQMIMGGVDIDHLLVVTFTKAAAAQMKEKITIAIQNKLVEEPLGSYMMDVNALETNDAYQMPVLFISGSCDWITPVDLVKEYADRITAPKAELYLVDGCGHSPQGQLPEQFANAVKDFLE